MLLQGVCITLYVNVRCCMVSCVRQDSQLPCRSTNSFLHLLLTSSPHPCLYYTPQICGFAHRQPFTHFCLEVNFYNANTFTLSKRFLLEYDKNCHGWQDGKAYYCRLFKLPVLCVHVPFQSHPQKSKLRSQCWFKFLL